MKRTSSRKPAHKVLTGEFAQNRNANAARKLRLDLSAVKGLAGLSAERGYGLVAYGSNNIGLAAAWVVARPLPFIKTSKAWVESKTIVEEK